MSSKLSHVFAAGALAALAITASPAQAADLRAEIPFTFHVGERALPAGTYHISTSQSMLSLRSVDGGVFVMTSRLESNAWHVPTLVFERTGGTYVLQQAWTGGGNGRAVPGSGREEDEQPWLGAVAQDVVRVRVPLL
jgi:hypothetical protein